jgi:alanyl-tRNA synthetase
MNRKELIQKYIEFFKSKDHKEIKNSSLVPENDPTVLFTTAGMHPLVPFLLGESHPQGKRLTNFQRCIRTGDIEEVGDSYHHTLFEMLGNWSLGDYEKTEAIKMTFEFHTKILGIPLERYAVTCFAGNEYAPKDTESYETWRSLGIDEKRIVYLEDNWWETPGPGPCGPDTEMFYWKLNNIPAPEKFDPTDDNWVEIGNNVLMQYEKNANGKYIEAKQKNIDFGGGVERTIATLNSLEDNYLADMWQSMIKEIEKISKKSYDGNKKEMRIIADHIKASVFIISDGVVPGNSEQGYILRRLIRRAVMNLRNLGVEEQGHLKEIGKKVFETYNDYEFDQEKISNELDNEEEKFNKTLEKGLREFEKMSGDKNISGKESFLLFQSYGFPLEMTIEMANEKRIKVDEKGFKQELAKHQELSRTASAGKFKSGLADNSEATKKLHTACHLLNEALRIVLDKPDLHQKGSNITPERLRFDFNFDRKLTSEELKELEELVNLKIQSNLPVECKTMPLEKAREYGAQGVFDSKYGNEIKVYHIGSIGEEFSKEICAGPHVENTGELGHFKIIKEQSSSSGVRRIKAVLE